MQTNLLLLLVVLSCNTAVAATIHKCKTPQGKLEYSELPCEGTKVETRIKNNPVSAYDGDSYNAIDTSASDYGADADENTNQNYSATRYKARKTRRH
jgi:hypothetical protein